MELTERNEDVLAHSLFELVLKSDLRRNVLEELRNCLYELDGKIVEKCEAYLKKADADQTSMIYQTSRNYLRDNFSRRPLYVAIKTIDSVLANPNFLRELFIILVVFIQFKDVVKKSVAPNTTEPIFRCYFGNPAFYSRFKTFLPEHGSKMQTVDSFIREEFSLLLIAFNKSKKIQ